VLILKLSGTSQVENSTIVLNVLWIDPHDIVQETAELTIEDIKITSINFAKSSLKKPLTTGSWTLKILHKKSLLGLTKFLVTPSLNVKRNDDHLSQNNLDKLVANFYIIKDTCISYNQKNIRDIVGSYLGAFDIDSNGKTFHKFDECKRSAWSSLSPDPKSELATDS
jgi:hypothetical protein